MTVTIYKTDTQKVFIIRETAWESIVTDTYTFGCMIGSCMVGYFLGITALEWMGGLIFILAWVFRLVGERRETCSFAEAHAKLTEWEKSPK